ncbi:neprilysin-2-like [Leptopilina heterotoma]|uniref:neprilysin-2-like n=1 Tax=Leptopilina heterotoma TaxID=63436 RepID=UPI001CA9FB96|nr:neprilysin-2-like [Leptopilina heterotoma]
MFNKEEEYINRYTSWRRRRLYLKCGLTIFCLAIFMTVTEGHVTDNDYCLTSECNDTAIRVLKYLDKRIDPCENFYKFACGNFPYSMDQFTIIENKVKKEMTSILEEVYTSTEPRYAKLIKTFYQTCMQTTDINKENIEFISNLLNTIGGWPLLEENSSSYENFQWEKFGSEFEDGVFLENSFIVADWRQDVKNNSNKVVDIGQPENFNTSSDYFNLIVEIVELFGADKFKIEEDIKQIVNIEKMLFNISVPEEERTFKLNPIRMTVKELIGNYSNILWKEYLNTYLKPFHTIKDDDIILINDDNYFKEFNNLIKHFSKRDQANYLIWKVVEGFLNNYVGSIQNKKEKSEKCYDYVNDIFDNSFGMLYIRKLFNANSVASVTDEMIPNIFQQFNKVLQKADWMDLKTKSKALEKLRSMFIVNPSIFESYSDNEIDEYYTNLEIIPGDFLESFVKIKKYDKYQEKCEFRKPINYSSWTQHLNPAIVNAMNYIFNNSLILSPAIFQGIFFNENRPQYMNYGSLGYVIGHELTHAFDILGRKYDKVGNLVNWWEPESEKEFLSKIECLIHQYGNYTDVNRNVKGERTQDENFADNGGVEVAYLAYEEYMRTHSSDLLLPGVNFTQRQLFWISFAQTYCEKITQEEMNSMIMYDNHSPYEFRVIGSLTNRPEFARDFQCVLGTKMNPENKCSLWFNEKSRIH